VDGTQRIVKVRREIFLLNSGRGCWELVPGGGVRAEATIGASSPQLGETLSQELHHEEVMLFEVATEDVAARVGARLQFPQNLDLGFEYCLLAVPPLELHRNDLLVSQIFSAVYFTK
jgi:hypothetical protein